MICANDRRAHNPDVPYEVVVVAAGLTHFVITRRTSAAVEITLPEWTAKLVGIKGVNGIVHRRNENDVVLFTSYLKASGVEHSSIDLIVHWKHEQLAKMTCIYVGGLELRFR